MGRIKILNIKHIKPSEPYDFIIDRTTPIGNPFYITAVSDRSASIKLFKKYLDWCFENPNIKEASELLKYLQQIEGAYKKHKKVRLFCWCAPFQCHGKIIKEYLKRE